MDPKALLTQKNIILGVGAAVIIGLVFVGIRILRDDPTSTSREAYRKSKGGVEESTPSGLEQLVTGERAPKKTDQASPSPSVNENSLLPGGETTTPTATPDVPGVIETTPVEVELQPAPPKKNIFTTFPDVAIPNTITDGSLQSRNASDGTTNVQTVFRTAPGRYLFNNLSPEALGASSMVMATGDESSQFNPSTFSPMGETIQLTMMENATTQNTEINVTASVWEPFYFQGNKLLDIGDKILGTAAKGKSRDRMIVNFYKIIFKDGKSLPINAVAQDIDGTYGVKGVKVGDVMLNSIAPLLLDTAAAFTGVIQELAYANVEALTVGNVPTQNPTVVVPGSSNQNPNATFAQQSAQTGGEGIGTVYQTISKLLAEDVVENKPYLLVPAGTRLQAYLKAPLDVSKAEYGK
jgi:hypothetical protein